jgi:phosphopantetheinyl transferase (holo-ACP synthase)
MSKKIFPFNFSLDNLIHSGNLLSFYYHFYMVKINQKNVIIGKCPKNLDKNELEQKIYDIKDCKDFWNSCELKEINFLLKEKKFSRLFDWLSIRVLLKIGLPLYWKFLTIKQKAIPATIVLLKNQWEKPFINLQNESNPNDIPFISVTHSKKDVFIALCSLPLGIDCELITNHSIDWERKIFSLHEFANFSNQLKKMIDISNETIYTLMWALKESTLKIRDNATLGMILKTSIQLLKDSILIKIDDSSQNYQGFISFKEDSVLALAM